MEHSEEIYLENVPLSMRGVATEVAEKALALGFEQGKRNSLDSVEGYSNMTEALKAGKSIDWAKLDGLGTKCVNKTVGTVVGMMDRNVCSSIDEAKGWWSSGMDGIYIEAFCTAWESKGGWTLWIEGEVPLIRKTADQLKVGTYFLGKARNDSSCLAYVGRPLKTNAVKTIYYAPDMLKAITPASEWVVLEEYGTFQTPEGK